MALMRKNNKMTSIWCVLKPFYHQLELLDHWPFFIISTFFIYEWKKACSYKLQKKKNIKYKYSNKM